MAKILALILDGPLQAWGESSKFTTRRTLPFPTRSGIFGMLLASKGVLRENSRPELEKLTNIKLTVIPIHQNETNLLDDFHTIKGVRKADETSASFKEDNTEITQRHYLQDAKFFALLTGEDHQIKELEETLKNPKFHIFLGRKSCPPAEPPLFGVFNSQTEAWDNLPLQNKMELHKIPKIEEKEEGIPRRDVPLDFKTREFGTRLTTR